MLGLGRQIISDDSDETRAMFAPLRSTHESFFPGSGERSFTFISNPVTGPLRSSDLIYGVAVSGPILRGSAIARDSSRVPLASTQQPNLLTAGRGYIPRKDSAPVVARAARTDSTGIRSAEKAASPKEEESVTKPRSFNRGSFRFELDESGVTTVFLTESAQPTPIARILKTTGVVEQVSLVGTEAPQNWNKFVGELFLIAVAPQLVGRFEGTSFQVESIEPDNLFNLVGLESGDLLASVDGVEMSVFDLEILPDLLLSGSATLVVRAGDRVRVVGISYVPGI